MEYLYNPERTTYSRDNSQECPFCSKWNMTDDQKYEHLIVYRDRCIAIMLNKFPYNPGHLLIVPIIHTNEFYMNDYVQHALEESVKAVRSISNTTDVNVGINLGKSSGGSVPDHAHWHVVPRFVGDTNFLAVIGNTKVVTKDVKTMYDKYKEYFDGL